MFLTIKILNVQLTCISPVEITRMQKRVLSESYLLVKFLATSKGMDLMKRHYLGHVNGLHTSKKIMHSLIFACNPKKTNLCHFENRMTPTDHKHHILISFIQCYTISHLLTENTHTSWLPKLYHQF